MELKKNNIENYTVPANAKIGHVHLKVSDIEQALDFYHGVLGFEIMARLGSQAAFISAGGYHHHIGLNTWYSKNGSKPSTKSVGLFHLAILYPTRRDLALVFKRLMDHEYPLTGTANHGVSEALYLDDPDGNGVELYWDRPRELWKTKANGEIEMFTKSLNIPDLLKELSTP